MKKIIDLIPYGQENRISKKQLMKITGYDEEKLKTEITEIRKEHIILSDTQKGGYWRPKTIKELHPIYLQTIR